MARPAVRIQVVEFGVLVGLALLVGRAVQVQILHGRRWAEEAQAQRTERIVLEARRGALYDRHGTPLAVTQETYHVGIAPNELRDPTADGALISRRLGLTAGAWQLALRRRYAYFAGPYSALEVQPLRSVRGVHLEPVLNRFYPDPAVARLSLRRVSPTDRVSGEGGKWRVLGRTITDDDPQPSLTMADAIRVSSNIAIAKFAARLTPEEQYAMLRDFGFGALTGIEFPAEATGRLRPPSEWTRPSAASLAMGYELSVTPIQVAMAYGALANDGLLLQPTLIREVRSAGGGGGGVRYRHRPEP